nr:hypothetical protein [Candidatus Sigynarchaeota archaeon]
MEFNKLKSAGILNVIIYAIIVIASVMDLSPSTSALIIYLAIFALTLFSYILIVIWGSQVKRKFIQLGGTSFLIQLAVSFFAGMTLSIWQPWEKFIINHVASWIGYIFLVIDCSSRKDLKPVVLLIPCIALPVIDYLFIELVGLS